MNNAVLTLEYFVFLCPAVLSCAQSKESVKVRGTKENPHIDSNKLMYVDVDVSCQSCMCWLFKVMLQQRGGWMEGYNNRNYRVKGNPHRMAKRFGNICSN